MQVLEVYRSQSDLSNQKQIFWYVFSFESQFNLSEQVEFCTETDKALFSLFSGKVQRVER